MIYKCPEANNRAELVKKKKIIAIDVNFTIKMITGELN